MMPTTSASTRQGKYIQANGLNMYYEEYGRGRPLILLHGGTRTSSMWKPYIALFTKHFSVITPDFRGHGRTNNPTGEFSYPLLADDIAAFVQSLGLTKPLICGKSDGGQVALEVGMQYPKLADSLVVAAAWYKFSERYVTSLKSITFEGPAIVNIEKLRRMEPDWVKVLKTEHARIDDPEYWQTLLRQLSTLWWTPLNYTAEDFHKISVPTLILMGDRDETVPVEQAVEMYHLIQSAELAILPKATHESTINELSMNIVFEFLLRHNTPNKQHSRK